MGQSRKHIPFELYLALRYLRFHRGRSFLSVITMISVAGVTVGTAALVIALSLMTGFVEDVRQRIHSGSAHLTVMSLLGDRQFDDVEGLSRQVEAVPQVNASASRGFLVDDQDAGAIVPLVEAQASHLEAVVSRHDQGEVGDLRAVARPLEARFHRRRAAHRLAGDVPHQLQ